MKKLLLAGSLLISFGLAQTNAQEARKAVLNEDGTISTTVIDAPQLPQNNENRQPPSELFSLDWPANPAVKNSRGTTLADLDGDGIQEIIYGADTELLAIKGDGTILWQKTVEGPILLPPTVVDLDGDNVPEVIVNTGYPTTVGRIYVTDNVGNDLAGWPLNFDDDWMINAPVVVDLDEDGNLDIITCRRAGSTEGYVHALKLDGTPINSGWPVQLNATPAFTPSIGDIDDDGLNDVVIATSSTGMYAFNSNGELLSGFPLVDSGVRYSYQSPTLVDLDGDETLEIVGANHGDSPGFYVLNHDATYESGWPIATSGWTYSTPTVVDSDSDGNYELFMADRNTSNDGSDLPTLFGFNADGTALPNFPISKYGGNEGVITIADINNDGVFEVIFGSVITDMSGVGYIHAYSMDGSGEVAGFPLRPQGFTFLNGAVIGDVDGDGMMDLTANSVNLNTGMDNTYITVYNLDVPYNEDKILRNGYKGSNSRQGLLMAEPTAGVDEFDKNAALTISPNPSEGLLRVSVPIHMETALLNISSIDGKSIFSAEISLEKNNPYELRTDAIRSGLYIVTISGNHRTFTAKWVVK
ncbi:FG-GAP-like repeat-containing protein [Jejudonia soesokkakensis]|uniref:FG-GAP-like repeat-containing protein n=1 Tax=Jejudonia soesokkakensis TaxID=1323432 RepID=A0ABW2MV55_9FLAO